MSAAVLCGGPKSKPRLLLQPGQKPYGHLFVVLLEANCAPPHPHLPSCFFLCYSSFFHLRRLCYSSFLFFGGTLVPIPVQNSKVAWIVMMVPTSNQQWRQNTLRSALGRYAPRNKSSLSGKLYAEASGSSAPGPTRMSDDFGRSFLWTNQRAQKATTTRL
jgi:hypothetical protein